MSVSKPQAASRPAPPEEDLTSDRLARFKDILNRRLTSLTIILDHLSDPHNISAVVRSAEAFGIYRVHVVHPDASVPLNPQITIGCERWLEVIHYQRLEECLSRVKAAGFLLYAADPNPGSVNLEALDFSRPAALIVGAELHGLSDASRKAADACYHIDMQGFTRSFNVSVAAALSLYISSRLRRQCLGRDGDLAAEEQERLLKEWAMADRERRKRR